MRLRTTIVAAGVFSVLGLGILAAQAAEQKPSSEQAQVAGQKSAASQSQAQERWRYKYYNGEWWYWLPANRWVYWRGTRWNNYDPKTFTRPRSVVVSPNGPGVAGYAGPTIGDSDVRPFYGHAESALDRRVLTPNAEVGPFYGHALPSEVFGGWRARRSVGPFYGHAGSYEY